MKVLRAGVAGAGVFGGHHARKYTASDGVELFGVFDRGPGRAAALAETLSVRGFEASGWDAFLESLDVLTIATPAVAHAPLAVEALARGVHVYVEKPLAVSAQEADAVLGAAREGGGVLACGHQERIVFGEMGLFDAPERPLRLEAVRKGTWTGRNEDVSVVLDLMIHDLDLALVLAGSTPRSVTAEARTVHGGFADESRAEIAFESGLEAAFTASRAAEARERTMRLVYPSGALEIDFLARSFRSTLPFNLNAGFAETARGRDPLGASVADFLAAVRGETERPAVTGEEARRALALALAVDEAARVEA
jgi:predicted dehydrogenase